MIRRIVLGLSLASGLAFTPLLSHPASAITFDFSTISGDTLTADQAGAFQAAAQIWSASLSDAFTVNVQIGFATLGANVLGATQPNAVSLPTTIVRALMEADAKDKLDDTATASLSTGTASTLLLTTAEFKALGGASSGIDGRIEFSNGFSFSTARNPDGTIAAGTYDLIGIAEHEIGHLLGFVSSIDYGSSVPQSLFDQFRYSAPGQRSVTAGGSAYFSADGGTTNLAFLSTGTANQASHWAIGTAGVMVPEVAAGQTQNITALDIQAMDIIGYDATVPEPWSLGLLALGAIAAVLPRRFLTQ